MVFAAAGTALALPGGDPTLGLTALQARLDASPTGSVMGYLKTVIKGSLIETIPVEVLAVTGDTPDSSLILFEAQGPKIDKIGGIAAGMSGSPIYLEDEGVDKVIGALSYGDSFTIGGSGLATPIEAMLAIRDSYAPRVVRLSAPVLMSGRVVDKVIVPTNPKAYKTQSQAGSAFIAKPLTSFYIGGVNPKGRLFAHMKKAIQARGQSVVALGAGLSAGASNFSTPLVPGAAVGALYSRGDLWYGGLGTVTYAENGEVLLFGHPMDWAGSTSMYLTNAWMNGIWPSQYEPYKMGYPTAIQGTITQDRYNGVLGEVGAPPAEIAVTARAIDADNPGHEATSAVYLTSKMMDNGFTSGIAGYAAMSAGYKLYNDQYSVPGSALTTTTVVVSDGTNEYTIKIPNMVDDSSDVPYYASNDVDMAVYSLLSVLDDGLQKPHFVSIDFEATFTSARRSARIVGVKPESSLKTGANRVDVSVLVYGVPATQTVEATVTIPVGTPTSGLLVASSIGYSDNSDYTDGYYGDSSPSPTNYARQTIAEIAGDLNKSVQNNTMLVSFYPQSNAETDAPTPPSSGDTTPSIDTTVAADWVPNGMARITATELTAFTEPITFGDDAVVAGEVFGPSKECTVSVYGTPAGETDEVLLGYEKATMDPDTGSLTYEVYAWPVDNSMTLRVHVDGGTDYTPADTFVKQTVRAMVQLGTSARSVKYKKRVTLTAYVYPGNATGSVTFQWYDTAHRAWKNITTAKTLAAGEDYARASYSWLPPKGSKKVRVVYGGCLLNSGGTSSSVTITVK
jgi:hypothetical protein